MLATSCGHRLDSKYLGLWDGQSYHAVIGRWGISGLVVPPQQSLTQNALSVVLSHSCCCWLTRSVVLIHSCCCWLPRCVALFTFSIQLTAPAQGSYELWSPFYVRQARGDSDGFHFFGAVAGLIRSRFHCWCVCFPSFHSYYQPLAIASPPSYQGTCLLFITPLLWE